MKLNLNTRFKHLFNALKRSGIIKNQKEFAEQLLNEEGNPVSQVFVSRMCQPGGNAPKHILSQIIQIYPFINEDFLLRGVGEMIDLHLLLKHICEELGLTQLRLAKELNDQYLTNKIISKMDNASNPDYWDLIFDYFNENYGYRLSYKKLTEIGVVIGRAKTIYVQRLFEVIEYAIRNNIVDSEKDFAERILEVSKQHISNMKTRTRQNVTVDNIAAICRKLPEINPRFILGVEENMIEARGAVGRLNVLESEIRDLKRKLTENQRM